MHQILLKSHQVTKLSILSETECQTKWEISREKRAILSYLFENYKFVMNECFLKF